MYTATIINKQRVDGILIVGVKFTDGKNTVTENITPQDRAGFNLWVKSRITSLDSNKELEAEDNLDTVLDLSETKPDAPVVSTAETAWNENRVKLSVLMELVRDGVFTGAETQIKNLQAKVKTDFKAGYLN